MRISDWSSDVCSSDLRTWRATRSCRLCFGNERAGALGVPPVAAATTGNARPWPLIIRGRFYRLRSVKWVRWQLPPPRKFAGRSEEHTSELQSLMRISYAVFCSKKKKNTMKQLCDKDI